MRALSVALVLLIGLLLAEPAQAGGFGVFDQDGLPFGASVSEDGGAGRWLDQGGGVEILLGYRKTRLTGRVRLSYAAIIDLAPRSEHRTDSRVEHAGLVSGGVQVELLKDLDRKLGLYLLADLGVAPLVTHLRAFMFADLGVGLRVRPTEVLELFVEATGMFRFDKAAAGGPLLYFGARFALD